MILLLALHAVLGAGLIVGGARLGGAVRWLAALAPAAGVAWLVARAGGILDGEAVTESVAWIPSLGIDLDVRVDGLSALMVALVSGIGVLVMVYGAGYFPRDGGVPLARLLGLLVLFSGSMLGLVVADNLLVLYGFWELTSITSFLLIGNSHRSAEARAAAQQALVITGAGGLCLLGGLLILGWEAGTFSLSEIAAAPPEPSTALGAGLALILLGAFTKSAQYPFHSWLPGAMVAPTPVSAYLHSATMVKAGVYLVARLSPIFALSISWWRPVVIGVGLVTLIAGGLRALRQDDLKVLLAHSTVSQLGLMMVIFGVGTEEAAGAGAALLVAHGLFKAGDFMVVGALDHELGTRDRRRLPRLGRPWAAIAVTAVVSAASMAGLPLLFGFIAKESLLETVLGSGSGWWSLVLALVVAGSALTAAYSARFAWGALGRDATQAAERPADRPPAVALAAPAVILASLSVALGVWPAAGDGLVSAAQSALHPGADGVKLKIWHGLNLALLSSAVALGLGAALFAVRERVERAVAAAGAAIPDGAAVYQAANRALLSSAERITAVTQPGSLPVYVGVITLTAAVVPVYALIEGGGWWPGWPRLVENGAQAPVLGVVIAAAVAAALVGRRFSAALFLGVAGYAMAGVFVLQGSPDLALTQAAIETLATVLFVLVLRRLPDRFSDAPDRADALSEPEARAREWRAQAARVGIATVMAATVFVLAIAAHGPDPTTPTSDAMIARSLPEGQGRNVTNVILVDFRGLDTLGEITVLAMAAIGTVALARAGRGRAAAARARGDHSAEGGRREVPPPIPFRRLLTLDISVRIVFAAVIVTSLYLLFVGHNQPGGGFVGGILAGAAVALLYVAGGISEVRKVSRGKPWTVLGAGVLIAGAVAAAPLVVGDPILSNAFATFDVPLLGQVKATSATVFDLGVYLAVLGLALMVFESFGDDPIGEAPTGPDEVSEGPVGDDATTGARP